MLSPSSPELSPKSHNFSTMKKFFVEKTFDRYLLFGLSSVFCQNSLTLKVCPPILEKKPNFQNDQKSRKNGTNIDIILSFLAKSVDKHSITLVHITYPPLECLSRPMDVLLLFSVEGSLVLASSVIFAGIYVHLSSYVLIMKGLVHFGLVCNIHQHELHRSMTFEFKASLFSNDEAGEKYGDASQQ